MAHSSNATKYEELRAEFLQAAADFDNLGFRLSIERSKASAESKIRHGRYDIPCHTEWPYAPWRECAVLVPCGGEMAEPYSRLKALSASAWLWLPEDIREALGEWIPKVDANYMCMYFQPWLWLLWVRDFVEGREPEPEPEPPGCAGVDMDPFVASASLIRDWRLNSDKPTAPACLFWGAKATHLDALETVLNELDSWKDYVKSDTSEECFPEAIEDDKTPGREPHPLWLAVENLRKHYRRQPPPTLTTAIDAWNDLRDNSRQRGDENRIEQRDKAIDAANRLREWVAGEIERIGSYEPGTEEEESKPKVGEHEEVKRPKPSDAKFQWTVPLLEGYVSAFLKEVEYPTEREAAKWIATKSGKPKPSRATLRKTYAWQNRPLETPKPRTTNEAQSGVSPAQNADAAVSHQEVTDAVLDIQDKLQRQLVDDERAAVDWELQQAGADEKKRDEAIRQLIQGFRSGDM